MIISKWLNYNTHSYFNTNIPLLPNVLASKNKIDKDDGNKLDFLNIIEKGDTKFLMKIILINTTIACII